MTIALIINAGWSDVLLVRAGRCLLTEVGKAIRQIDRLRREGFQGTLAEYREILGRLKDDKFSSFSDEELIYTRDEAEDFCNQVREETGLPSLPRTFVLRSLIGIRKHSIRA